AGRLAVLGIGITAAIGIGAVLGATGSGVVVSTLVISLLAGAATAPNTAPAAVTVTARTTSPASWAKACPPTAPNTNTTAPGP
ncbi:hypothetical protein PXH80_33810, partial [Mycolicibacterium smegmatis]|nr:hypothetical protein [Mycolicibacterium smegmatis]